MVSTRQIYRIMGKLLVSVTIFLIFFNEFLAYQLNQFFWAELECQTENCTRILLVADPELLGDHYLKSFYNSLLVNDYDRFVKKTFNSVTKHSNPHIIAFLGDLLNEGSVATPNEYKAFVERFEYIFNVDNSVKLIHIPGDNDIGGENGEYISNANVRRFEIDFTNDDIFDYEEHLRFFKVNRMLMDYNNPSPQTNHNRLRIAITHMPLLLGGGRILRNVLKDIDPHIIFSGHHHCSRIFFYPSLNPIDFYESRVETFDLERLKTENTYLEIMVPTASYRMKEYRIGYGMAIIENYTLRYTVLWTVSRFIYLKLYLAWIILSIAIVIIIHFGLRCPKRIYKRQYYDRISAIPHF